MKNILDVIKGMDKAQLNEAVKRAKEFAKTEEGQQLVDKLKNGGAAEGMGISAEDKNNIMKELEKNPDIAKKISDILNGKG